MERSGERVGGHDGGGVFSGLWSANGGGTGAVRAMLAAASGNSGTTFVRGPLSGGGGKDCRNGLVRQKSKTAFRKWHGGELLGKAHSMTVRVKPSPVVPDRVRLCQFWCSLCRQVGITGRVPVKASGVSEAEPGPEGLGLDRRTRDCDIAGGGFRAPRWRAVCVNAVRVDMLVGDLCDRWYLWVVVAQEGGCDDRPYDQARCAGTGKRSAALLRRDSRALPSIEAQRSTYCKGEASERL